MIKSNKNKGMSERKKRKKKAFFFLKLKDEF